MADEEEGPRRGGNFLTRKVGPLPMWGWIAAVAVGVGVFVWRKRQNAAAATGAPPGNTGTVNAAPDVFGASGYQGYSPGQQVGGYDQASSDSFLQQLQGQLSGIQSGVQLNPAGVGQVTSVVSTTPSPVAVPNPQNAPITAANPIDATIESQYQQIAGRPSDPAGLAYWRSVYLTQGPQAEAQQFSSTVAANKTKYGTA